MDSGSRQLRSTSRQEEQRKKVSSMTGVGHFGTNVSSFVSSAMAQGGSLDQDSRRTMYGKINAGLGSGTSLESVLPGFVADHIKEHQRTGVDVLQSDHRVAPRKSESYLGHQLSSTRVNPAHDSLASEKTISEPLSPQPHSDDSGSYHRTHASPFNLVGTPSNDAHTVWAPSWANVTVDGHIEKRAQHAANKGHEVFHFRVDTDTQSTVGFVKNRSGKDKPFKAIAATYERR